MPIIKPISDLRNHFNEISEICHREGEPVFITKNGKGDLVVMSISEYERRESLLELYGKLGIAEEQSAGGTEKRNHGDVIKRLRDRSNDR